MSGLFELGLTEQGDTCNDCGVVVVGGGVGGGVGAVPPRTAMSLIGC